MSAAFASAPWRPQWLEGSACFKIVTDGEKPVAYTAQNMRQKGLPPTPWHSANAHLIAAAPELYEAGINALRELDCLAACIYHDDQREEVQAFANKFRAALAKARGEQ